MPQGLLPLMFRPLLSKLWRLPRTSSSSKMPQSLLPVMSRPLQSKPSRLPLKSIFSSLMMPVMTVVNPNRRKMKVMFVLKGNAFESKTRAISQIWDNCGQSLIAITWRTTFARIGFCKQNNHLQAKERILRSRYGQLANSVSQTYRTAKFPTACGTAQLIRAWG